MAAWSAASSLSSLAAVKSFTTLTTPFQGSGVLVVDRAEEVAGVGGPAQRGLPETNLWDFDHDMSRPLVG